MVFQRPRGRGAVELAGGFELVAGRGPGGGVPAEFHEHEREGLLHFIGAGVAGGAGRFQVDLACREADPPGVPDSFPARRAD